MVTKVSVLLGLLLAAPKPTKPAAPMKPLLPTACSTGYADTQLALQPDVRDFENSGKATYTRLIRTEATYETLYYGPDGAVQRRRHKALAFGTGVAYMRRNEEVFFLTNHHVAVLPSVTSDQARVDGVPVGAKKVSEESRLVENDSDENYARQLKLTKVVLDPLADAAILKTRATIDQPLTVMPYKIGKSSEIRAGDYVLVRGFPLGVFQAVNVGRVTNPFDEDFEQGWMHRDFIIDALLSSGNSGSPVFAIDCKSGTLELVGLFHAAYRSASALNSVIAIDDVRELMETLRVPKRAPRAVDHTLGAADRGVVTTSVHNERASRAFPFGGNVAAVAQARAGLGYTWLVYDRDYPAVIEPRVWLTDLPTTDDNFGALDKVGFRDRSGLPHELEIATLDAGVRGVLGELYHAVTRQFMLVETARRRERASSQPTDISRELTRQKNVQRELVDNALDALFEEWGQNKATFEPASLPAR